MPAPSQAPAACPDHRLCSDGESKAEHPVTNKDMEVGSLDGKFTVNGNGGASYVIGIEVPPGTAGMQPNLHLQYNSQASSGLIGVGWSLAGLSSIARCAQTAARDGEDYRAGINYDDDDDRYCIDGQRLIAIDGRDGQDGTEYRTEQDTWSTFTSHGECDEGPCWFSSIGKDGSQTEYGRTDDSRSKANLNGSKDDDSIRTWSINRIEDRNGNYVYAKYKNDDNQIVPEEIRYTGNKRSGLEAERRVRFEYEKRPDEIDIYLAGDRIEQDLRLEQVKTFVRDQIVAKYKLNYRQSDSSKRSLLESLQRCDGDEGICLPKTKFSWSDEALDVRSENHRVSKSKYVPDDDDFMAPADLNGDGKTDILYIEMDDDDDLVKIRGLMAKGNGDYDEKVDNLPEITEFKSDAPHFHQFHAGDVNADGLTDVLWTGNARSGGGFFIITFINEGGGDWVTVADQVGGDFDPYGNEHGILLTGDVDGDKRTDLIWGFNADGDDGRFKVRTFFSKGNGKWDREQDKIGHHFEPFTRDSDRLNAADMNGDGCTDIVWSWNKDGRDGDFTIRTLISQCNGEFETEEDEVGGNFRPNTNDHDSLHVGDINGDGLADLVWAYNDDGKHGDFEIRSLISRGDGRYEKWETDLGGHFEPDDDDKFDRLHVGDFNGDGLSDVLWTRQNDDGFRGRLFHSEGDGDWWEPNYRDNRGKGLFESAFDLGDGYHPDKEKDADTLMLGDGNGDGVLDLLWAYNNDGDLRVRSRFFAIAEGNGTTVPDLVTQIENGFGGKHNIRYRTLATLETYSKGDGKFTGDIRHARSPLAVVREHETDDGREGTPDPRTKYSYSGARHHRLRGWMGFRHMSSEALDGLRTVTKFYQEFPLTGLVESTRTETEDGKKISVQKNDYTWKETSKGLFRPYNRSETTERHTRGELTYTTRVEFDYDDDKRNVVRIGNLGDLTTVSDDVYNCLEFADKDDWRGSFIVREKVSSEPGACERMDSSQFSYGRDFSLSKVAYDRRMNATARAVWDNEHSDWNASSTGYDEHGNVVRTVTAEGVSQSVTYDHTFKAFPERVSVPDPNDASKLWHADARFDARFGIPIWTRNIRGVVNMRVPEGGIDAFGRVREVWAARDDSSDMQVMQLTTLEKTDVGSKLVTRRRVDKRDNPDDWPKSVEFSDAWARVYKTESTAPEGRTLVKQRVFDRLGLLKRESLPYFKHETDSAQYIEYFYDDQLRPTIVRRADGAVNRVEYDVGGDLRVVRRHTPHPAGGVDDNESVYTQIRVDALGRVLEVREPTGGVTRHRYDALGRLVRTDDPMGGLRTQAFDSRGLVVRETSRETGTNSAEYDRDGRVIARRNAADRLTRFAYDSWGRLQARRSFDGAGDLAEQVVQRFDGSKQYERGRLTQVEAANRTVQYDYNKTGTLREQRVQLAALDQRSFKHRYTYRRDGTLKSTEYPNGAVVFYEFGNEGALERIRHQPEGHQQVHTEASYSQYNAFGDPGKVEFRNGTVSNFSHDAFGRLVASSTVRGGLEFVHAKYVWNRANKLLRVDDERAFSPSLRYDENFRYDASGRLLQAENIDTYGTLDYRYDLAGNMTRRKSEVLRYENANKPHLLTGGCKRAPGSQEKCAAGESKLFTLYYDKNGNLKQKKLHQGPALAYEYDTSDRLVSVTDVTKKQTPKLLNRFSYDEARNRLTKTESDGTTTYYVAGGYELVWSPNGTEQSTYYVFGPRGVVMAQSSPGGVERVGYPAQRGKRLYFHNDHLEGTAVVTGRTGAEFARMSYEPYGTPVEHEDSGRDKFRPKFTGKEYDSTIQLYYFGSRYLDPHLGRFISPDPARQMASLYVYGMSDPLSYIDPDGEFAHLAIAIGIGAGVGALGGAYAGGAATSGTMNPAAWDWASGKTWGGIALGGALGGATGALAGAASFSALASVSMAGVVGPVLSGPQIAGAIAGAGVLSGVQEASFTALGGGSFEQAAASFGQGFLMGTASATPVVSEAVGLMMATQSVAGFAANPSAETGIGLGMAALDVASMTGIDGAAAGAASRAVRAARRGKRPGGAGSLDAKGPGCTGSSFVAGTLVWTAEGERPIEEIEVGDLVWARDESSGRIGLYPVLETFGRVTDELTTLNFEGRVEVTTTWEHPFHVAEFGWVPARELQEGMLVDDIDRGVTEVALVSHETRAANEVFNFAVADAHTYFVSEAGAWVHNCWAWRRRERGDANMTLSIDVFGGAISERPDADINPGGWFDVVAHGNPKRIVFGFRSLSARTAANRIRALPQFQAQQFDGVRLLSCRTGACPRGGGPSFAQRLANELNMPVRAPIQDLIGFGRIVNGNLIPGRSVIWTGKNKRNRMAGGAQFFEFTPEANARR